MAYAEAGKLYSWEEVGERLGADRVDRMTRDGIMFYCYDVERIAHDFIASRLERVMYQRYQSRVGPSLEHFLQEATERDLVALAASLSEFTVDKAMLQEKRYRLYGLRIAQDVLEEIRRHYPQHFADDDAGTLFRVTPEAAMLDHFSVWNSAIPTRVTPQTLPRLKAVVHWMEEHLPRLKAEYKGAHVYSRRHRGENLVFYHPPVLPEMLALWSANSVRMYQWADTITQAARCRDWGTVQALHRREAPVERNATVISIEAPPRGWPIGYGKGYRERSYDEEKSEVVFFRNQGFALKEIAVLVGIPLHRVKDRLYRRY